MTLANAQQGPFADAARPARRANPGDSDTRPQVVRLRAANRAAGLTVVRPVLTASGFLRAEGTVSRLARGVVRVQMQFVALFTGFLPAGMRGDMRSFQVLPAP